MNLYHILQFLFSYVMSLVQEGHMSLSYNFHCHSLVLFSKILYITCCFRSPIMCAYRHFFDARDCRFSEQIWKFMSTDLQVWLSVRVRVMKTNFMHYFSSVYFVNQILQVSGIFTFHHQEVYCIYTQHWYILYFSVDCLLAVQQKINWKTNNVSSTHVT